MIKQMFSLIFFVHLILHLIAQKPAIDISISKAWPKVQYPILSNDGKFAAYTIDNVLGNSSALIVYDINTGWSYQALGARSSNLVFTEDSKYAIFIKPKDSLCVIDLATEKIKVTPNVGSFKIGNSPGSSWTAYQLKQPNEILVLKSLDSERTIKFSGVKNYYFAPTGKAVVLETSLRTDSSNTSSLQWFAFEHNKMKKIWTGEKMGYLTFDDNGGMLTFISQEVREKKVVNKLWYYKNGDEFADELNISKDFGIDYSPIFFSKDGARIFFKMRRTIANENLNPVKVDVWNYKDRKLQAQQLRENARSSDFIVTAYSLSTGRVLELTKQNEKIVSQFDWKQNDYLIVEDGDNTYNEWYWNIKSRRSVYLISSKDGRRHRLPSENAALTHFDLSPSGKFILFYDYVSKNYFSYEISTEKTTNITRGIKTCWTRNDEMPSDRYKPLLSGCWINHDSILLLCDRNDVWQIDPTRKEKPINITNAYGRKRDKAFSISNSFSSQPLHYHDRIIVNAFDNRTKQNGFFEMKLHQQKNPVKLIMDDCFYNFPFWIDGAIFPPIKAKDADIFLVRSMSAQNSPNFYVTADFKSFKRISDVQPEKKYNWLAAELVGSEAPKQNELKGVLFKPEDFNPQKKYPAIVILYEKLSDELNIYKSPVPNGYGLNVPLMASNGYIILEPDIHYKIGSPCQSVYDVANEAIQFFKEKPWVDNSKIGIYGHSFGGYEVNCLITKTNKFTAAVEAAGVSDLVSFYGNVSERDGSDQFQTEDRQSRIGVTLWQNPKSYIDNSPVFSVDKINTPLLIMHNKNDNAVPWAQGIEMFTALRRLDKRAWLLQYDDLGGHQIVNPENAIDYTVRTGQFFDHYLKGAPAPVWMTQGIPARLKQIETGYSYDPSGNCGKDCKVCKYWNERMKKDSAETWKEIEAKTKSEHWIGGVTRPE